MNALRPGWDRLPLREVAPEVKASALQPAPGVTYELWSVPSFSDGRPELLDGREIGSIKRPVRPQDVLICKINPRINRVWKVGEQRGPAQIASPEWIAVRPNAVGRVDPDYLKLFLSSPEARARLTRNVSSVTGSHARAKSTDVMSLEVPVPPLTEQRRIVDLLEDHLSRLDAAQELMGRNDIRAVSLQQSWLRHALAEAPNLGEWHRLGDVLESARGGWSRSARHIMEASVGVPYLKMNNITRRGRLDLRNVAHVEADDTAIEKYGVRPGDVLFNSKNSGDLIGKTAVADLRVAGAVINENIMRLRFDGRLDPEFAALWFLGPPMRSRILGAASASTNVAAVYQKDLVNFPIWVPELREQAGLVAQFEHVREGAERLQVNGAAARSRGAVLRRAILGAAFTGRLTGHPSNVDGVGEALA